MNSAVHRANPYGGPGRAPYTRPIMPQQKAKNGRLVRCHGGGNSLGESRVAMSEVQIGGIPKLSPQEVAPTP